MQYSHTLHVNPVPSKRKLEGLTTIPLGSTRLVKFQRGSAIHPAMDEDIVYSAWKHVDSVYEKP